MKTLRMALLHYTLISLLLTFTATACRAQDSVPNSGPGELIEPYVPENTDWALNVVDLETGKNLISAGNATENNLIPASLMKLITTGAVLDYSAQGGTVHTAVNVRKLVTIKGKARRKRNRKILVRTTLVVQIRNDRDLFSLLRDMNVHSRNLTAQSLAFSLGEQRYGAPGNREKGNKAVGRFLAGLDLPVGQGNVADGCGLNRNNRFTAGYLANYLYQISKKPWYDTFRATLPRPGIEGTVRRIGYTNEQFRVKTGYLNDVYALAGYGINAAGREFAFAFIINGKNGRIFDRKRSRGELLRLLAENWI